MRTKTLSRLEVLENEERSRERNQHSSLETIFVLCWKILLAYHVGGLNSEDEDPGEAEARALNYQSRYDYLQALFHGEIAEINKRFRNACRRLFTREGLDLDRSPPSDLSSAVVRMVDRLPEQWLQWLESNRQVSRNSRVFTQIGKAALQRLRMRDKVLLPIVLREESRACFCAFRRYIHPEMKVDWWQHDLAKELQLFYCSFITGHRPKLVIMAPPQHGKTQMVTDFVAWLAGKQPDIKTLYATYSGELGGRVNKDLQRIMTSQRYLALFGRRLSDCSAVIDSLRWSRNINLLEYVGHNGSFRNTTVEGPITGMELDCGIVDDPVKGRAEASSKSILSNVWNWFTDDFFTRFSDSAGLLMIMTRWHVDDPVGRFIERFPGAKILRYPAIAEEDEKHRLKGEALFPQHKSLSFLMERRALMTQAAWESEYQQSPIVVGGGMFPIDKLHIIPPLAPKHVKRSVRYWDKAGTSDGGAYTAGVLLHMTRDNTFVVGDVRRGRWAALERERIIKQTADADRRTYGWGVSIWVEQEPGSSGKESAEATVRMLAGHKVKADKVTGSKEVRAEPYAAQVQAGNVALAGGTWNRDFIDEHESFPTGKYKDQVDAASGAFNKINSGSTYDSSMSWVR